MRDAHEDGLVTSAHIGAKKCLNHPGQTARAGCSCNWAGVPASDEKHPVRAEGGVSSIICYIDAFPTKVEDRM